jgi:hypothetical protein
MSVHVQKQLVRVESLAGKEDYPHARLTPRTSSAYLEVERTYEISMLHLEPHIVQRRGVDPHVGKLEAGIRFHQGSHGVTACQPELAASPQDLGVVVS